jgi:tRNA pseudouridine55 synthase
VTAAFDGILIVDKPEGMTSHDVVATVRRRLPRKTRVGHTGTLDPFATGVLPVVIGKATRLSQFLTAGRKRYRATVAFGTATDTGDRTGTVVDTAPPDLLRALDATAIEHALATFIGVHPQLPPAHSAKKVDGERAYVLARRGDAVELSAVEVTAHLLTLASWDAATQTALLDLDVSAGYYVRSLARDLGAKLGVPAHVTALQRTGSGSWSLADAHSLADVVQSTPQALLALCEPMSTALPAWPALTLDPGQVQWVLAGRAITLTPGQAAAVVRAATRVAGLGESALPSQEEPTLPSPERVRLLDESGALVALARPGPAGASLHADIVLL